MLGVLTAAASAKTELEVASPPGLEVVVMGVVHTCLQLIGEVIGKP